MSDQFSAPKRCKTPELWLYHFAGKSQPRIVYPDGSADIFDAYVGIWETDTPRVTPNNGADELPWFTYVREIATDEYEFIGELK